MASNQSPPISAPASAGTYEPVVSMTRVEVDACGSSRRWRLSTARCSRVYRRALSTLSAACAAISVSSSASSSSKGSGRSARQTPTAPSSRARAKSGAMITEWPPSGAASCTLAGSPSISSTALRSIRMVRPSWTSRTIGRSGKGGTVAPTGSR